MLNKMYTTAGHDFSEALTRWLQDTRLMSEAIYRLGVAYHRDGTIKFTTLSWPKTHAKNAYPPKEFVIISPDVLHTRVKGLLHSSWKAQFILLESLWEEYLQGLVQELQLKDASIFEPFCDKEYMIQLVRDVLTNDLPTVNDVKVAAAARFAAGITRVSFKEQWKQLKRLEVGLNEAAEKESWFDKLDIYFEIRNCIIHRNSKVSHLLKEKEPYYKNNSSPEISIWPNQLDFFRTQFLECLRYMEHKIKQRFAGAV